jgi:tight adherence protein B
MSAVVLVVALGLVVWRGPRRSRPTSGLISGRARRAVFGRIATRPAQAIRHAIAARRTNSLAVLPDGLDAVARGLRSGLSLQQALAEAPAPDLAHLADRAERGQPLAEVCRAWAASAPDADSRLAAAALGLAAEAGGRPARAVDGVVATLRERRAVAAEVRAQSAQARLSAAVLAGLPLAVALVAAATDDRVVAFWLGSAAGRLCLAVGLGLQALGVAWIASLVRGRR